MIVHHQVISPATRRASSQDKVGCLTSILFFFISLSPQGRSSHLTELVQKSGSDSSMLQSPRLRPKPRPPGRCTGPADQSVAACHRSRSRPHTGLRSPIYISSSHLSPGEQDRMTSPFFKPGPQVGTSPSPTPSSSELLRYSPTHRRGVSSICTNQKNL